MNGHEVQIVVEAGKGGADAVLFEVRASGAKQVRSTLHHVSESSSGESHANRCHFDCDGGAVDQFAAPGVHRFLPLGVALGDDLGVALLDLGVSLSNRPEEAPLGVPVGREGAARLVFLAYVSEHGFVVAGLLGLFGGRADLVVHLGVDVVGAALLEVLPSRVGEVLFHKVDIVLVEVFLHARILQNGNAVLVEGVSNKFALLFPLAGGFLKVCLSVDNWNLGDLIHCGRKLSKVLRKRLFENYYLRNQLNL